MFPRYELAGSKPRSERSTPCGADRPARHGDRRVEGPVGRWLGSPNWSNSWPRLTKTPQCSPNRRRVTLRGPRSRCPKGGKKQKKGGQPGHEQYLRSPFPPEAIDECLPYTLDCCPDCGGARCVLAVRRTLSSRWKSPSARQASPSIKVWLTADCFVTVEFFGKNDLGLSAALEDGHLSGREPERRQSLPSYVPERVAARTGPAPRRRGR